MKRQKNQFLLLVILLVIGIGAFFGVRQMNQNREEKEEGQAEDGKQPIEVYVVEADDIVGFSYDNASGEKVEFYKNEEQWLCRDHEDADLSEDAIESALGIVSSVTANAIIEDGAIEEFGLDVPSAVISVNTGGETVTFTFGMQNSMTQEYYFTINEDNSRIYAGDGAILSLTESAYEDYLVLPVSYNVEEE